MNITQYQNSGTAELLSQNNGRVLTVEGLKKTGISTGIDYDPESITAAMVSCDRKGRVSLEALEKIQGTFVEAEEIIQGLVRLKERLPHGIREKSVSCLRGKNIYAAQKKFRHLPPSEMISALSLDIRKYISFDMDNSTLDYHYLEPKPAAGREVELMVTVVDNELLTRHLNLVNRAGFYPKIVDILPLSLANAHWATVDNNSSNLPYVIIHRGHRVCTLVITGRHTPFYFRTLYFTNLQVESAINQEPTRADALKDEVIKSLDFYTKFNENSGFSGILLSGYSCNSSPWQKFLSACTSLEVVPLDLAANCGFDLDEPGEYDIPIVLALRGQE